MNDRLTNLPTLSKTITMGNKSGQSNASYDNRNMSTTVNQETKDLKMLEKSRQQKLILEWDYQNQICQISMILIKDVVM